MLTLLLVLLILLAWGGGVYLNVGSLIHFLLLIALVVVIVRLINGRSVE